MFVYIAVGSPSNRTLLENGVMSGWPTILP